MARAVIASSAAGTERMFEQLPTRAARVGLGVSSGELPRRHEGTGRHHAGCAVRAKSGSACSAEQARHRHTQDLVWRLDSTRAFRDLSVAISNIKSPQVQGLVARTFGVEALLLILREGPAAIAKYQEKVRQLGGVIGPEAIRRAESFGIALNYLSIAGQGLRNTIGDALIPAMQPLVESLTKWISVNRELIGTKVGQWAKDFAAWVKDIDFKGLLSDLRSTVNGVASFVDSIGGWKVAAIGVGAVMAGPRGRVPRWRRGRPGRARSACSDRRAGDDNSGLPRRCPWCPRTAARAPRASA